jgi:hypothetical protein
MAEPSDVLTHWRDPVLGELVWREADRTWCGSADFAGRVVRLSLGPVERCASPDDQTALIEPSRAVLEGLRRAEPHLRRQAAKELVETAVEPDAVNAPTPAEVFAELELEGVNLWSGGGVLVYNWSLVDPAWPVLVYFGEDFSFEGVEVDLGGGARSGER